MRCKRLHPRIIILKSIIKVLNQFLLYDVLRRCVTFHYTEQSILMGLPFITGVICVYIIDVFTETRISETILFFLAVVEDFFCLRAAIAVTATVDVTNMALGGKIKRTNTKMIGIKT